MFFLRYVLLSRNECKGQRQATHTHTHKEIFKRRSVTSFLILLLLLLLFLLLLLVPSHITPPTLLSVSVDLFGVSSLSTMHNNVEGEGGQAAGEEAHRKRTSRRSCPPSSTPYSLYYQFSSSTCAVCVVVEKYARVINWSWAIYMILRLCSKLLLEPLKGTQRGFRPRGTWQKFVIQVAKKKKPNEKYCKILIRLKAKSLSKRKHNNILILSGISMNIFKEFINFF